MRQIFEYTFEPAVRWWISPENRIVQDPFRKIVLYDNVSYFPAYEMATIHSVMLGKNPFAKGKENFHVNEKTVDHIMEQFFCFYAKELPERT